VPAVLEGILMPLSACNTTLGNWGLLFCTGAEASASAFLLSSGEGSEGGKIEESTAVKAVCWEGTGRRFAALRLARYTCLFVTGTPICVVCDDGGKDVTSDDEGICVMLDGYTGVEPKGSGLDICSCAARLRRWRKRNPKITKTAKAKPPITPPAIAPTGVELFTLAEVPETTLPGVEEVEDMDAVVDDSVPFLTMR
jgi:hypothetical protein